MVPLAGLEPALLSEPHFECGASTNFTTGARGQSSVRRFHRSDAVKRRCHRLNDSSSPNVTNICINTKKFGQFTFQSGLEPRTCLLATQNPFDNVAAMNDHSIAPPSPTPPPSTAQGALPVAPSDDHRPRLPFGQIAVAALIILAILGVALIFVELTRFFMLVFAAIVIGAIFDTIASFLTRRFKLGRGLALALSVFSMIAVVTAAFTLFGSQLAGQIETIQQSIPGAVSNVEAFLDRYGWGQKARELTAVSSNDISTILSQAGGYALAAGSGLADFVLVLVGAIFLASDPATYRRGFLLLIPKPAVKTMDLAMDDVSHGLRGWMLGQSVSSLVVAGFTWAGLELLGVPASAGLGFLAGLLDVIPMIGPIIAGLPAVLLAFTVSPMTALWTLILYLVIQQLQGNFLQPMIQKQAVNVPPAVLLFAVIAAGLLFGMMGILLAAPLTVVIFVLVQRIYVQNMLGKDIDVAGRK